MVSRRRKALALAEAVGWLIVIGGAAALCGRDGKDWAMRLAGARDGR